jgi:2'-hydroxyisoflavone reductase
VWNVSSDRARDAGLACRPLRQTIADTWDWLGKEDPVSHERAASIGMDPQKERDVLAAWREHVAGRQRRGRRGTVGPYPLV